VNDTSKIQESIVVCSLYSHQDTRKDPTKVLLWIRKAKKIYRLKPIDITVLKKLSDVVNVVPVIAKSDSLTLEERAAFKERVCTLGQIHYGQSSC